MTPERESELRLFGERLGHRFEDLGLLDRALTHASRAHEDASRSLRHNEPLEFLGDAILGFLVAELLHAQDPEADEGSKSRARAHLVSAASLARRAARLGIPELLALGRGEEKTGGRKKSALWANALEATIAAVYLDGGIEAARRFARAEFGPELAGDGTLDARDHKTALQELLQARGAPLPVYVLEADEGPSHRPHFRVRCEVEGRALSSGAGDSKKRAQQEAARRALEVLRAKDRGARG